MSPRRFQIKIKFYYPHFNYTFEGHFYSNGKNIFFTCQSTSSYSCLFNCAYFIIYKQSTAHKVIFFIFKKFIIYSFFFPRQLGGLSSTDMQEFISQTLNQLRMLFEWSNLQN